MLRKLFDSISTLIINGLKAGTSVVQNAQVASVAARQSGNESNRDFLYRANIRSPGGQINSA